MKVLHVYKEFHPDASGVARHIDGFLRSAARLGVKATILAPSIAPQAADAPYAVRRGGLRALAAAVAAADVVHVHGARVPIAAAAAAVARGFGRPVAYTPHCYYDDRRRAAKWLWDQGPERALLAGAGAVFLLDTAWRDYLAGRGLPIGRCRIVPNCILAAAVAMRRPDLAPARLAGCPSLISIGRLDPVKRLDDAIAALSLPGLETAVLHLVGRGNDQPRLEHLAIAAGVAGRVIFHGWLDDEEATALLLGADLALLPSEREGMPTAMLEALLLGVPILASDIPGNRAVADPTGWTALHPLADVAALAEGIRSHAGRAVPPDVRAAVAGRFSWEARAPDIVGAYAEMIAQARPIAKLVRRNLRP